MVVLLLVAQWGYTSGYTALLSNLRVVAKPRRDK